jgi:hypothetical protein
MSDEQMARSFLEALDRSRLYYNQPPNRKRLELEMALQLIQDVRRKVVGEVEEKLRAAR